MPRPQLQKLADRYGVGMQTLERYWSECNASAGGEGDSHYARTYACVEQRARAHAKVRMKGFSKKT